MALAFPSSPTNGQRFAGWQYDSTEGKWNRVTSGTAARAQALELLSQTSLWTAQDAVGSDLPSRTAALPATLTGLTRVDGPAVVLPAIASNMLVTDDVTTFTDPVIVANVTLPTTFTEGTIVCKRTSALCFQLLWSANAGGTLTWSNRVGGTDYYNEQTAAGVSALLGQRVWLRVTRTQSTGAVTMEWAENQSAVPTSWTSLSVTGTPHAGALENMATEVVRMGANRTGLNPFGGVLHYLHIADGAATPFLSFTPADIAAVSGDATTITATSGQTVTVNRAASGRQTLIVPRGSVLVNADPTNAANQGTTAAWANAAATDDVVLTWHGHLGDHATGNESMNIIGAGGELFYIYTQGTSMIARWGGAGGNDLATITSVPSVAGRTTVVGAVSRADSKIYIDVIDESGTVTSGEVALSAGLGVGFSNGISYIGRYQELTYAATAGVGLNLVPSGGFDDDTLVALHDLLALQKWDEVEALSAVIGGMTPTERDKLTGLGETIFVGAGDMLNVSNATATNYASMPAWQTSATLDATASGSIKIPEHWNTANVYLWWGASTTAAGNIVHSVFAKNLTSGSDITGTSWTSGSVTHAAPTSLLLQRSLMASGQTTTGGSLLKLAMQRVGSSGSDTYAAVSYLYGVELVRTS
jgi:hypothetical protein